MHFLLNIYMMVFCDIICIIVNFIEYFPSCYVYFICVCIKTVCAHVNQSMSQNVVLFG